MQDSLDREYEWKKKRVGRITSSQLPNLMKKGRGKPFGDTSLTVLYGVKYERRTKSMLENVECKAFQWGHDNEPLALDWLRMQMMNTVKSCSDDFEEIVFCTPFEGFGDSPDGYIYDFDGNVEGVVEVKCPISQPKFEKNIECTEITNKHEYYGQFLGHFLGTPSAKYLLWVVYDGYGDCGYSVRLNRSDCIDDLNNLEIRIKKASAIVDESLKTGVSIAEIANRISKK